MLPRARREGVAWSVVDSVVAVFVGGCDAAIWVGWWLISSSFATMFRDFGVGDVGGELPWWTRVCLTPAFPAIFTTVGAAALGIRLVGHSRASTIVWVCMPLRVPVAVAALLVGLYLPIFQLAGRIQGP